jgi:ATP-dependent helicase HrpB
LLESVRRLPSKLPRALFLAREQIASSMRLTHKEGGASDEMLARCVLQAFPDRVGKVSDKKELVLNLCGGGSVVMRDRALLESATFFVLPEIEEMVTPRGKKLVARCAVGIEPEWLFDFDVREESLVRWNSGRKAVEEVSSVKYGELILSETVQVPKDRDKAARLLLENWQKSNSLSKILGGEEVEGLLSRLSFLKTLKNPPAFIKDLDTEIWLQSYVTDSFTQFAFKEFAEHNLKDYLMFGTFGPQIRKLNEAVPEFITIGTRKVPVNYSDNQPPWIESRIQDFFGMREGPKILGQNLTLHLLAPNKRAVQVTQDLAGFWTREYPKLRIELGRRYPRHKWPENPV